MSDKKHEPCVEITTADEPGIFRDTIATLQAATEKGLASMEAERANALKSWPAFREYCREAYDWGIFPGPGEDWNAVIVNWRGLVGQLWEMARQLGGTGNPPPPWPSINSDEDARGAIDALIRWVNAAEQATTKPPTDSGEGGGGKKPTIWYHGVQSYSLDCETPIEVSKEQHAVLQLFLKTPNRAVSTKSLTNVVENPSAIITKLARKFGEAVRRPEDKGAGYFIRVRALRKPR